MCLISCNILFHHWLDLMLSLRFVLVVQVMYISIITIVVQVSNNLWSMT